MNFNKHNILDILKDNKLGNGSLIGEMKSIQIMIAYTVYKLQKVGWDQADIEKVIEESKSGDYFYTYLILSLCLTGSKTVH